MRIGIDVRYLSHGLIGGVHAYVAQVVPALIDAARDHKIVLYADTKRPFELPDLPGHVTLRVLPWRNGLSSIRNDLFLRRAMEGDDVDVAHFPANYGWGPRSARTIITLHDAINVLPLHEIIRGHPKTARTLATMTYLHACTTLAVRRADLIFTVSEWAANEIAHSGVPRPQIVAVPHAPAADLQRIDDAAMLADVRDRYGLPRRFVLADALKNPATLVRAWQRLPFELRSDRQIVFFARRSDPLPIVGEAVAAGDAQLLVQPPRADLIALYSMADAFVFPSWTEGFGIPILEAMRCGAPVIASDRGAIGEVAGGAALLADAEDDQRFAQHLARVLDSPHVADDLRERGYRRAAQFGWRTTAERMLECYEQVFARPDPIRRAQSPGVAWRR